VETKALLVKQEELKAYLEKLKAGEEEIVSDLERILVYVDNPSLREALKKRLREGNDLLEALRAGFVPVRGLFSRVDTTSKWDKNEVKRTLASMPPEVRDTWDRVKELGIFDSFSVTVRRTGDPLLVGNKGRVHYFIAGWLPICPGVVVGIKLRLPLVGSLKDVSNV